MNKFQKVSYIFKLYMLISALFSVLIIFVLWLLGKSDNKLCRNIWNMISAEYAMAFLVLARPFMSQRSFEFAIKSHQDKFAHAMVEIWRACGIVK